MRNRNPRAAAPIGGSPSKAPLKHTPFPGLIDEHKWTVLEGRWPSFIDRKDMRGVGGVMQVPLDNTNEARKLRLHEQAHVAFTPNIGAAEIAQFGVEERTIGACEDGRIIQMMNDRNEDWAMVNVTTNILPPALLTKHGKDFKLLAQRLASTAEANTNDPVPASAGSDMTLLEAARLIAGSRGYAEGHHFDRIAEAADLGWIVPEVEKLHRKHLEKRKGEEPSFEDTIAYAQELERLFEDLEEQIREQAEALAGADLDDQMPAPVHPIPEEIDSRWGEMLKETAPLTEKLRGDPSRRTRSSDTGSIPRYMHRLPTDQRIFGRRRKHRVFQGTVLIDLSGSMSLEPSEVDEILTRWPAVTIATYSGGMPEAAHQGMLRVVAKNGRRASIDWLGRPAGGDNLIDGPALDWLAKQRGPRVWISDGGVTGVGGQTEELLMDAARKVSRGKIKRIPNVQQLIRG